MKDSFEWLRQGVRTVLLRQGAVHCGLLVGFSGGPDSVALLETLHSLAEELSLSLLAVHGNHGIRPSAAAEEAFCRSFCEKRTIPFRAVRADLTALAAQWNLGLEAAGRRFRYESFRRIAAEEGMTFLCTAHHGDDLLESQLLHFVRGCGIRGMVGIRERQGDLLRPLLFAEKADLLRCCEERGLPFVTDESNTDSRFRRNALRERVVPLLKEMNPSLSSAAGRTSALAMADSDYLDAQAARCAALPEKERRALPDPLLLRILEQDYRLAAEHAGLAAAELSFEALCRLRDLYRSDEDGAVSLPGGLLARRQRGRFFFAVQDRRPKGESRRAPSQTVSVSFEMTVPRTLSLPDGSTVILGSEAAVRDETEKIFSKTDGTKKVYKIFRKRQSGSVTIESSCFFLRRPLPGETVRRGGKTRAVRELLREREKRRGISRDNAFLLCDSEGILYLPGIGLRDGASAQFSEGHPTDPSEAGLAFCFPELFPDGALCYGFFEDSLIKNKT